MQFLGALGALAADLAARGRVLPGLDSDDTGYCARWRPVLAGADALRARELTLALPPLCRATTADGEPSADIVIAALGLLTDAAVRARLAESAGVCAAACAGAAAPLTDRWAAALTGEDGTLAVGPAEAAMAAQLAFVLWTWQDAAQEPPGPVRTCFRLIEPEPPSGPRATALCRTRTAPDDRAEDQREAEAGNWRVEFALQSTDDPSLLLPAADIWSGGSADGWAAAGISYPDDDLLAGLGRASRLFPELDAELQSAAPDGVELDTRAALSS